MASFDFIDASMKGYQTAWEQRRVIVQLSAMPFFIKLGCYAAILFLGLEQNFLRQGLVLMPSFFAEGFFLSYLICFVMRDETISSDMKSARPYARDILSGTIVYVLIKLGISFVAGSVMNGMVLGAEASAPPPEPGAHMFVASLFVITLFIWMFRFMWLYIPAAMGVRLFDFVKKAQSFMTSFYMIGCWLMCFIPFGILMLVITEVIGGMFPRSEDGVSLSFSLALAPPQALLELMIAVVSSIAMAYGIRSILKGENERGF